MSRNILLCVALSCLVASSSAFTASGASVRIHKLQRLQTEQCSRSSNGVRYAPALQSAPVSIVANAANAVEVPKTAAEKMKVGGYFALWYAFNIGYNIFNKKALTMAPTLTWTIGNRPLPAEISFTSNYFFKTQIFLRPFAISSWTCLRFAFMGHRSSKSSRGQQRGH